MKLRRTLLALAAAASLILFWGVSATLVDKSFLPLPTTTLQRLVGHVADGTLARHIGISAARIGLSLLFSVIPACLLGLAAGRSRRLDAFVTPFVYILHPLPKVAFLPIIMLFLGLGNAAKVFLIWLIIFGQLMVSARDAARSVPPRRLRLGTFPRSQPREPAPSCHPARRASLAPFSPSRRAWYFDRRAFPCGELCIRIRSRLVHHRRVDKGGLSGYVCGHCCTLALRAHLLRHRGHPRGGVLPLERTG